MGQRGQHGRELALRKRGIGKVDHRDLGQLDRTGDPDKLPVDARPWRPRGYVVGAAGRGAVSCISGLIT